MQGLGHEGEVEVEIDPQVGGGGQLAHAEQVDGVGETVFSLSIPGASRSISSRVSWSWPRSRTAI